MNAFFVSTSNSSSLISLSPCLVNPTWDITNSWLLIVPFLGFISAARLLRGVHACSFLFLCLQTCPLRLSSSSLFETLLSRLVGDFHFPKQMVFLCPRLSWLISSICCSRLLPPLGSNLLHLDSIISYSWFSTSLPKLPLLLSLLCWMSSSLQGFIS